MRHLPLLIATLAFLCALARTPPPPDDPIPVVLVRVEAPLVTRDTASLRALRVRVGAAQSRMWRL